MTNEAQHLPVLPAHADAPPAPDAAAPEAAVSTAAAPDAASSADPAAPADAPAAPVDPTRFVKEKLIEGKVIEVLQSVFDPEIPVNIYELGLIYAIKVNADDSVDVKMTLTAPACPVAGTLPGEVETKIQGIEEVTSAKVELVWDPPWSRERMSEAALLQLGFM